jgi:hypothetical protein
MSASRPEPYRYLIASVVLYVIMFLLFACAMNMAASMINDKRQRKVALAALAAQQAAAVPASRPVAVIAPNIRHVAVIPQPPPAPAVHPQPIPAAVIPQRQVPVHPAHPQPVPVPAAASVINLEQLDLEASMSMNSDDVCSICFSHRVCVTMKPCNHTYTCRACGSFFVNRPCGLCRQFVTSIESIVDEAGSDSEEDNAIEMVVVTSSSDAQKASDVLSESAPF